MCVWLFVCVLSVFVSSFVCVVDWLYCASFIRLCLFMCLFGSCLFAGVFVCVCVFVCLCAC